MRAVRRQLRELEPSAILATPANIPRFGAKSNVAPGFLREAARLGIPTFSVAATWDSFTSKGTFTVAPCHVLCWNDFQREAAVVRLGLDPARVHVTGSPRFGHDLTRGRSLLASPRLLTPEDAPEPPPGGFVVWVVGSGGITSAEDECQHISGLADALSGPRPSSDVKVLVRPYPDRSDRTGGARGPLDRDLALGALGRP